MESVKNIGYALLATAICAAGVLGLVLLFVLVWPVQLVLNGLIPDGEGLNFS